MPHFSRMKSRFQTRENIARQLQHTRNDRMIHRSNADPIGSFSNDAAGSTLTFSIKPVPPFRLDLTVWTLRRRASNLIDRWDGKTYRRVLMLDSFPVEVAVSQTGSASAAQLHITSTCSSSFPDAKALIMQLLERLLGWRIDLTEFYRLSATDKKLSPLVKHFRGAKPPRFPTLFEALVNAIACQQMSLSLGIILLSRLSERFGKSIESTEGEVHAFPRPEDVMELEPRDFRELGFSLQKGRAIIALAQACATDEIKFEKLENLDNQSIVERLVQLRGIGRWSAEYVLLRGLGRTNVYPGDDVGARNNLQRWLKLRKPLDYEGVYRITKRWQPYAGLVYFHMLLDRLADAGKFNCDGDLSEE